MFEALRRYLDSGSSRLDVFFRDDDANCDLPELRRLLDLFGERRLPVSLAVIPGTLQEDGARLLRSFAGEPWLELHQHGWMHVNHEPGGRKCEFGPSRGLERQREDIAQGRDRLASMLEGRCAPIFTPPWNRCTSETAAALEHLAFRLLSKDQSPPVGALPEISISVDIFRWKNGAELKGPDECEAELCRRFDEGGPAGVLLHHKEMLPEAFALVESLLDTLRASPRVSFHTLEGACASQG